MGTTGTITGEKLPLYKLREGAFVTIYRNADDFMFGRHHGKQRDEFAVKMVGLRTTYTQLDYEVERAATALYAYGIRQGDYVSFAMPNLKETIVYIYACWRIGAVANLIDPRTNSEGILERVERTHSKLLITVFNLCGEKFDCILDRLPCAHVILVNPYADSVAASKALVFLAGLKYGKEVKEFNGTHTVGGDSKYVWHSEFINSYTYDEDIRACYSPGMAAAVVYTSGTASDGVIKGAVLTHEALNAAAIGLYYSVR
ncbi:MAG: acyl--CoA ligase, partial [Firmicutes bacterium]|nr:acyl--CoA ligase [Bacillota bacterium]